MLELDPAELARRENSRIVKSAVSPRPIAWVSTVDEDGRDNLAPYSSYNYVSSAPPVVVFNASRKENGDLKDSARNALDTGEFVVNVVTESVAEQMDRTSENVPRGESEFDLAGIERADCSDVAPPRVADAVVSFECTLYDSKSVYEKTMVFGDVRRYHIAERVLADGELDMRKLDTVGRLGGPYYTNADRMELERRY